MSDVVELRVHGVGGSTPEALLGVHDSADTALVAGDDDAGFYARRAEPTVEGYVWGNLTSGGIAQTFWIVLLPFTLLNVAGWMFPTAERSRSWLARRLSRSLLGILGISLTLGYVLWLFSLATIVLLRWHRSGSLTPWLSASQRVIVGSAVVAVVGLAVYLVSRSRQLRFEAVRGPVPREGAPGSFASSLVAPQELEDPSLWADDSPVRQLLYVHMTLAVVGAAALGGWALSQAARTQTIPRLDPLFRINGIVQAGIGIAVLLLYVVFERPSGFRFAGPATMAFVASALTAGFFAGGWHLIAATLTKEPVALQEPLGEMAGVFGATFIASLVALGGWAIWHACRTPGQLRAMRADGVPRNTAPQGQEQDGLSPGLFRRTAWIRAFATGPRHADLVLTAGAGTFALLAIPTLAGWVVLPNWIASLGRSSVYLIVGAAVPFFVYRARKPDTRRRVAIVWDVLTFFPRRFHPFAVRPYSERAVPELQGRIAYHVDAGRRVIVCGHSQGSVIALAALAQLTAASGIGSEIALVTFGSPLTRLHARFFPELFGDPELFPRIRSTLVKSATPCAGWRNFYRRTDYVGQELFACTDEGSCDEELPDPPQGPITAQPLMDSPIATSVDPPPPAWVRCTVHSYYLNELRLRAWVGRLKEQLR